MAIAKSETVFVRYCDTSGGCKYIITSNAVRDTYFLYRMTGDKAEKIAKSKSPQELENKYNICEEIRVRA